MNVDKHESNSNVEERILVLFCVSIRVWLRLFYYYYFEEIFLHNRHCVFQKLIEDAKTCTNWNSRCTCTFWSLNCAILSLVEKQLDDKVILRRFRVERHFVEHTDLRWYKLFIFVNLHIDFLWYKLGKFVCDLCSSLSPKNQL